MNMQAIVVDHEGGPDVMKLKSLPVPEPKAGQVRIKVAYSPLNPLDTHARADRIKWNHPGFPFTPGYEYAGRIDAVGEDVDAALLDQRVAVAGVWGGNAEYAIAPAARVREIPAEFNWQIGACYSTCAFSAWHLLHSAAHLQAGEHLVLHSAAGAVAIMCTQIAKELGAVVHALVGSDKKARYVEQFGADYIVNYREQDWVDAVKNNSDGQGANVIIDGVVGPDANKNYEAIAPLGNVIYTGAMAGPGPDVNISMLIGKSFSVTGFVQYFHQAKSAGAEVLEIVEKLASGTWRIPIERIVELDQVPHIHAQFEQRELFGRTLIKIAGDI